MADYMGEFVSVSTSQVFNAAGNFVGTQDSFGFGAGLSPPLSGGYYTCNSVMRTVIKPSSDKNSGTASTTPSGTVSSNPSRIMPLNTNESNGQPVQSGSEQVSDPNIMPSSTDENSEQPAQSGSEQDSNKEGGLVFTPTEDTVIEKGILSNFIGWLIIIFR